VILLYVLLGIVVASVATAWWLFVSGMRK